MSSHPKYRYGKNIISPLKLFYLCYLWAFINQEEVNVVRLELHLSYGRAKH
jgi:hypothetical protein